MFKKIMFATSATETCDHAARVAFEIAGQYKAKLTLFHVLGVPSRGYSLIVRDVKTGEDITLDTEYEAWVLEEIKTHYSRQIKGYPNVEVKLSVGHPHREILRAARKDNYDLIIMGGTDEGRDLSSYKRSMAGTTLQRVAKAAKSPVLVVARPAASFWGGISSIVFGTDFSKASNAAFDFAKKLASELKGELHIFHAVDISQLHAGKPIDQDEIEIRLREARNKIQGRYVKQLEGIPIYSVDVWEGVPYVEIVKYAREKQADLIVMAHHARETDPDMARLGSNMEQVIVRANCPVVSINRHPAV